MFFRKKIVKGLNKTFLNIKIFLKKFIYFDSELTKDLFFIIEKLNFKELRIVDVGAYKGLWINRYLKKYPNVIAYLIEPYEESFVNLQKKFRGLSNIKIFKIGLSNINAFKEVNVNSKSYTNSLLELDPEAKKSWSKNKFEHLYKKKVETVTLENFVDKNKIERINILKLDVQGYESRVIKGGEMLLKNYLIDILVLEVIVAPTYKDQSKISEIFTILDKYNYKLYGIYDIEKNSKREKIQQFDVIFYSPEIKL